MLIIVLAGGKCPVHFILWFLHWAWENVTLTLPWAQQVIIFTFVSINIVINQNEIMVPQLILGYWWFGYSETQPAQLISENLDYHAKWLPNLIYRNI